MRQHKGDSVQTRSGVLPGWLHLMVAACVCAVASAAPPEDPLPTPLFSVDADSPIVWAGVVVPADVLTSDGPEDTIGIAFSAANLGAANAGDDINAMSYSRNDITTGTFSMLFSVERRTLGLEEPDLLLVEAGVPYNVKDQAARGHAAGDQYLSTALFTRSGPIAQRLRGGGGQNNTGSQNQYDEGGTSFGVDPPGSSKTGNTGSVQGEVDATAGGGGGGGGLRRDPQPGFYYCLTSDSPSLMVLPGNDAPSGAHIFFHPDPSNPGRSPSLFARWEDLGLQQTDDIDAIIVFDLEEDGSFGPGDQVLFSLTPGSPSLNGLGQAAAGAYVLSVLYDGMPTVLATPDSLGLGADPDDIDALDVLACSDGFTCALQHGIRSLDGDIDDDGDLDLLDASSLMLGFSGDGTPYGRPAPQLHPIWMSTVPHTEPLNVSVLVGDTVRWVWMEGLHDVTSGQGGVFDGCFSSEPPTDIPGTIFDVAFDAPFLGAHPKVADTYPYLCSVHWPDPDTAGRIFVQSPPLATFDFNDDDDLDLGDYGEFAVRMTGP